MTTTKARTKATGAKKKTTTTRTKKKTTSSPMKVSTVSSEIRMQMIQEAAYYRAERRGFSQGDALQDWVEAEREIDQLIEEL